MQNLYKNQILTIKWPGKYTPCAPEEETTAGNKETGRKGGREEKEMANQPR
jgi:hypothetical protein